MAFIDSSASEADIREFRANLALVRRHFSGRAQGLAAWAMAVPVSLRYAIQGIARYGRPIRRRDGIGLVRQFAYLFLDGLYGIRPSDFYTFRLQFAANRPRRKRHFGYSRILPMQIFLLDADASPDYPVVRQKDLFASKCLQAGLPAIPFVAKFADGKMTPCLQDLPPVDLFSKPCDLMLGIGAQAWLFQPDGTYLNAATGERYRAAALIERLCTASRSPSTSQASGDILLQRKVTNHDALIDTLTTGGLSTVRIVSCIAPDGSIDFLPPAIRMPVGDGIADNVAAGGLAAPIDPKSGRICGPAVTKDERHAVGIFARHPTTGCEFDGFQLPFWPEVGALAARAHRAFPSLHFVGWDIAILPEGPVLLEGNAWWGVELVVPHGIALGDTQFVAYYNHHLRTVLNARGHQAAG